MIPKEEHELLGGVLLAFVLLVFAVTIAKLAGGQIGSLQGY